MLSGDYSGYSSYSGYNSYCGYKSYSGYNSHNSYIKAPLLLLLLQSWLDSRMPHSVSP